MAKLIDITGKVLSGEWGTDDETGNGIPVLRTTNFTNEGVVNYDSVVTRRITKKNIEEKYLRPGDIILEKSGGSDKQPVGRVIYYDGPEKTYLFNNFTGLLRVKDSNQWFPRYVFYSLFANYRKGGTREYENKTTGLHNLKVDAYVSRYEVTDAVFDQQKEICERLDIITEVIRLRRQELQKLDELIKARFVELFGDPVSNPKGWKKKALSDEAEIKIGPFGSLLHKEDYIIGGHALVNPSHIVDGKIAPDNKLTVTDEKYDELSAYHLQIGDVVMGRRGEMGRCAVVEQAGLLCGTGSLLIRTNGDLSADYIQKIISFPSFKRTIEDMAVGQTMPNLNVPIVSAFQIIKPPKSVQDQYYAFVAQVDKSKVAVQSALDEAQLLFDSLMQEYFG
ncbi:MAG: restriction endonuclease subunit S [Lachnospiraceae bacterium]|nr:restriction endonuclease subunit S [Lachnospiraceae bacterium]